MIIFVNNIPLHILLNHEEANGSHVVDLEEGEVTCKELSGRPLIRGASYKSILDFVEFLQLTPQPAVQEVYFAVSDLRDFKKYLRRELQVVKAAGGVVEKPDGTILMMKRLGYWDLPKGKAEKGEKSAVTAVREVEEECNVKVFADRKLVTTWHTYLLKGELVIKRTRWYRMILISDRAMRPQAEEGIDQLEWMGPEARAEALQKSYRSIAHVLDKYTSKFPEESKAGHTRGL